MKIRLAKQGDKEKVLGLLDELIKEINVKSGTKPKNVDNSKERGELYDESMRRDDIKIFVAEENGALVGLLNLFILPVVRRGYYQGYIEDLVVNQKMRGKSIGTNLIREAKNSGRKTILITSNLLVGWS